MHIYSASFLKRLTRKQSFRLAVLHMANQPFAISKGIFKYFIQCEKLSFMLINRITFENPRNVFENVIKVIVKVEAGVSLRNYPRPSPAPWG